MTLGDYLLSCGGKVRVASRYDCCTFPADWAIARGHPDPMRAWRRLYTSEAEAEAIIFDGGGLATLFAIGMWEAGVPEIDPFPRLGVGNLGPHKIPGDLREGDIGVLEIAGDGAGAIYTGKRWALAAPRGIVCASIERECVLRVWRP